MEALSKAAEILTAGGLVAIPTETVYGLAANALNPVAVSKIFQAKERPSFNPLIVHLAPEADPAEYVLHFSPVAQKLAAKFWPGPISLLLNKKELIPDIVTSGMDTVVLRKPAHPLSQQLLQQLPFPLAAPSANKFMHISPSTALHVKEGLGKSVDFILDGGPCKVGLESTIVDCRGEQAIILRFGGISQEQIEEVVGPVSLQIKQHSNPLAPGQMDRHYATRKPLHLVDDLDKALATTTNSSVIYWGPPRKIAYSHNLSPKQNFVEAASQLFQSMHKADAEPTDQIVVQRLPNVGLGRAINDRLERADHS